MKTKFLFGEIDLLDELCAAAIEERDLEKVRVKVEGRVKREKEPIKAVKISSQGSVQILVSESSGRARDA